MIPVTSAQKGLFTDYNSIARDYYNHEKNAITLWFLGYQPLLTYLKPVNHKSILDYGSGTGSFCRILRVYNATVTGVDTSEGMIMVSKESQTNGINYNQIASGNLDFLPDQSFDFVVSNFVFCTISTRNEIMEIMKSIHRVLKKNGSLVIMNANWDKSNGKEFISFKLQFNRNLSSGQSVTSVIKTDPPIILNDYYWSKADYINLLTESGYEIHDVGEPLARGNFVPWIAEKTHPPYQIIYAKK